MSWGQSLFLTLHGELNVGLPSAKMKNVLHYDYRKDNGMETTTVSPKYQVVIPARVRRALGIRPGQKVQVIPYEGRIELIPITPIKQARGFLKGIDTSVEREADRA